MTHSHSLRGLWIPAALAWLVISPLAAAAPAPAEPRLWALELGVADTSRAIEFYTTALGFEVLADEAAGTWTLLGNGEARLALARSNRPVAPGGSARAYPNFTVGDVEVAGEAVIAAGGSVGPPFESPVGTAVAYTDPFGHGGHLIDHPWDDDSRSADAPPEVFNVALSVRGVETAEAFYTALGFPVRTRDYLPQTLVFEPRGSAQLILHPNAEEAVDPGTEAGALLLDVDPGRALAALRTAAAVERTTPATASSGSATIELRDPDGNLLKLARRTSQATHETQTISGEQARAAFERLKGLAGEWQAKSSRGWDEPVTYEIVAAGSVVVEIGSFKDAPEKKMYTMFHLDGDRLLATHYCESRTQPRLVATAVADGGRQVTFTYLDGTGLTSRDQGHMDQAVFRFLGEDRFTAHWTWYQQGNEQWLEEIEHRRAPAVEPVAASR